MNLIQIDRQTTITKGVYYETRILQSGKLMNRMTWLALNPQTWEHAQALREAIAAAQLSLSERIDFAVLGQAVHVTTGDISDTVHVVCGITERLRAGRVRRAYGCGYLITVYADELREAIKQTFGKAVRE